jgi:hypothetical protein
LFCDPFDLTPQLTFYGSGDFHHVTLALLRRQTRPFNLLILDNHPDWMRGLPFLHCGTWLWHAARLPLVRHVYHAGGEVDFDNAFRWLAPWALLRGGKIRVFPALRRFRRGPWARVDHQPLRASASSLLTLERVRELLEPFRAELAGWPLYVSVDKDVMRQTDAVVNWDSGRLDLEEACAVLQAFYEAAEGDVAGVDVLGDWSPVRLQGWFRQALHLTEHPRLRVDPDDAARRNQHANLALCDRPSLPVGDRQVHFPLPGGGLKRLGLSPVTPNTISQSQSELRDEAAA